MYNKTTREEIIDNTFNKINKWFGWYNGYYDSEIALAAEQIVDANGDIYLLNDKQIFVLRERLGLNDEMTPKTLDKIGEILGICRASVKAIEDRATRLIAHRIKDVKDILLISEIGFSREAQKFIFNNSKFRKFSDYLTNSQDDDSKEVVEIREKVLLYLEKQAATNNVSVPIEELDLSIKTYNCLKCAGVYSLEALLTKTKDEVKKIPRLSKGSFYELVDKVLSLGCSFVVEEDVESSKKTPLSELGLSPKVYNSLQIAGVATVEDLVKKTPEQVGRMRNIGKVALEEIISKISYKGYNLAEKEEEVVSEFIPLSNLGLSSRAHSCLERAGIHTVEALLKRTPREIEKIRNVGKITLGEIVAKVNAFGYELSSEQPDNSDSRFAATVASRKAIIGEYERVKGECVTLAQQESSLDSAILEKIEKINNEQTRLNSGNAKRK